MKIILINSQGALAALLCALITPAVSAAGSGACATQAGGGTVQAMDNWVVNGDQTVTNQTIRLKGPIQVASGTLTLRNVALEIDSPQISSGSPGAAVAIDVNTTTGASLAISGSSITSKSASTGVIQTSGAAGSRPTSVLVDHTCLTRVAVRLSNLATVKVNQNEFLFTPSESYNTAISLVGTSNAEVNDNIVRGLDGVTPPGIGAVGFTYVHDSQVLRNSFIWTAMAVGLDSSWNNHVAQNTWQGGTQSAGFDGETANWWLLNIIGRGGAAMGLSHWANNNLIEKNTFIGGHSGMFTIADSFNNRISQNTLIGSGFGFTLRGGSGNVLDGNEIRDIGDDAVHVFRSHDNSFTNNRIYTSGRGISLYASDNNTLASNAIADSDRGIFVHESAKNTIDGNTVSGAVQAIFVVSDSNGNRVDGNNILASDEPAWDDGTSNTWKGNFWGKASGGPRAIAPASAADSAPAAAMLAPVAAVVPAFAPPPFSGPVDRGISVQDQQVWQGARTLDGGISVESGSSLTLRGATITYAPALTASKIMIHVMPGGSLTIEDSKIVGPRWDLTLYIQVEKGAVFSMKRSEIDNAGDWVGQSAAVSTFADDTVIEDNTFVNVYCAMSSEGGRVKNLRFVNNKVIGAVKAIAPSPGNQDGAVITGNRVSRYGMFGFDFVGGPAGMLGDFGQSHLTDNTFSDGWGEAMHVQYDPALLEIARNNCISVKGPCQLTDTGGMDQLKLVSSSPSAAQPGDGVAATLRFGHTFGSMGNYHQEDYGYSAVMTSGGSVLQDREVALAFGSFTRIPLSAVAAAAASYDITVGLPTQAAISVSKPELHFAAQPGSNPPPQALRLVYRPWDNHPWAWTVSSDSSWLRVTPEAGAANGELTVTANSGALAPGVYTGKIQVSSPGEEPRFIGVTLTVTGELPILRANPPALSFGGSQGSSPKAVSLTLAQTAFPLPFAVAVQTDFGGNWLSATADGSTTPATLTVSVNTSNLSPGQYVGEVRISMAGAGNGPLSIPVTVTVAPAGSAVSIVSVVNAASFDTAIAPESWVTITGANLSRTTRTWGKDDFVQGRLPTSLDGVQVSINGLPAYVYFISPTQLNVLAPLFSGADSDPAAVGVEVTAPDGTAKVTALMRKVSPGVFVFGGQNAAAVHSDGSLVCTEGSTPGAACRPAKAGEVIQLYVTGLGTNLSPAPPDGVILSAASALRDAAGVTLGGAPCKVLFQGLVSAGLYQINIEVPDVAPGDQPLVVMAGGSNSQAGPVLTVAR